MVPKLINLHNLTLPDEAPTLLHQLFPQAHTFIILQSLANLTSPDSWLYQIEVVDTTQTKLPVVIKIAPAYIIEQEWQAYQNHIQAQWSSMAQFMGNPITLPDQNLAAISYTLMGAGKTQVQPFHTYCQKANIKDIGYLLHGRILHTMQSRMLRTARVETNIPLRASYDPILPVNLLIEPRRVPTTQTVITITPERLPTRHLQPGEYVSLAGFLIIGISPQNQSLTLNLPKNHPAGSYRVRIQGNLKVSQYQIGQQLPRLEGVIRETRFSQLAQSLTNVMLEPTFTPTNKECTMPSGLTLLNPLTIISKILGDSHSLKIGHIHGNLRLSNILVDPETRSARLIDFATARYDHVLHDLLSLESDIVNSFVQPAISQHNLPLNIIAKFYEHLHQATFLTTGKNTVQPPHTALTKPFYMLKMVRQTAHNYALANPQDYTEYYQGLTLYLLSTLKLPDSSLDRKAPPHKPTIKEVAFWAAAAVQQLLHNPQVIKQYKPTKSPKTKATKRMLGTYEIRSQIGKGGMAYVVKAYQASLKRFVAIKLLSPQLVNQPGFAERFQREAEAIAQLSHPHILPVYDTGVQQNYHYIVMRYVPNSLTLEKLMRQNAPQHQLFAYLIQVADALNYTHQQGIIHRDIKPANILIDGKWALLTDFGLVKEQASVSDLTNTNAIMGTPAYMSPEQVKGEGVDQRTDIYALGAILHRILTGKVPHESTNPLGILSKRITQPITGLRQHTPNISVPLEHVTLRALATNPEKRFKTALDFARALQQAYRKPTTGPLDITDLQDAEISLSATEMTLPGNVSQAEVTIPSYLPTLEDIQSHLKAIADCHEYNRWGSDDQESVKGTNKDKFIAEEGKLLPIHASPYEIDPDQKRASLIDILRLNKQAVVLGEAGSGKTTTFERLMWEFASQQTGEKPVIPVMVRLLDFGGNLLAKVRDEIRARGILKLTDQALQQWLDSEQVHLTFMFDGMNEVPGSQRELFLPQITSLMRSYPEHRYIMTSRVHDDLWERLWQAFPSLTVSVVQPIKEAQVKAYLRSHLGLHRWWQVWRDMDNRLKGLATRPLMLWLIKEAAADREANLPHNRGELFDSFVRRTLRRERAKGTVKIPDHQKHDGLTCLAWAMQIEHRLSVPFDEATQILVEQTDLNRNKVVDLLREASLNGLLYGDDQLRFMHQSLQEHFVASNLLMHVEAKMKTNPLRQFIDSFMTDDILQMANDDWWAEPFIHTAGLMSTPDWLINRLAKNNPWLAYWCMDEGRAVSDRTRQMVEQSSTMQLSDPDVRVRRRAVESLLLLNNTRVMTYLLPLLADEDPGIGQLVYQALLAKVEHLPTARLFSMLQDKNTTSQVRQWIADLLTQTDDLHLLTDLLPYLADEDEQIGKLVYRGLQEARQLPLQPMLTMLIEPLPHKKRATGGLRQRRVIQVRVRTWVLAILTDSNRTTLVEPLLDLLAKANEELRQHIVQILTERLNQYSTEAPLIVPHLLTLLTDDNQQVGQMAFNALQKQPKLPQESLLILLDTPDKPHPREWAIRLLADHQDTMITRRIIPLLQDRDSKVREAVYERLEHQPDLPIHPFIHMLTDSRKSVRLKSIKLMVKHHDESLIPRLIKVLHDDDSEVRYEAGQALLGYNKLPRQELFKLLRDPHGDVRNWGIQLLAHTEPKLTHKLEFCYVPAGEFLMGSDDTAALNEKVGHTQILSDYWMGKHPVTIGQYYDYLQGIGKAPTPGQSLVFKGNWRKRLDHPIVGISWAQAIAYCEWLAKVMKLPASLPPETYWEKAARGRSGQLYPWGNEWNPQRPMCNIKENRLNRTSDINKFIPQGNSPYGCCNMLGNVWEWTLSELRGYPYRADDGRETRQTTASGRVVRGGSFNTSQDEIRCTLRGWRYQDRVGPDVGFRVMIQL